MRQDDNRRAQGLYRIPSQGKLMGVCAGVADAFGWQVTTTRILAIIALLWFNVLAVMVYVALGFLLPTRQETRYDRDTNDDFRSSARRPTGHAPHDARHRFNKLDLKLQHMEAYVTSNRYDLDRQFRDLEH